MLPKHDKTSASSYDKAIQATDEASASICFHDLVEQFMRVKGCSIDYAEKGVRQNLGYIAGYHGNDTRVRVERLYQCEHPIFGKLTEMGEPTTEEALAAGILFAKLGKVVTVREIREHGPGYPAQVLAENEGKL